jgi:predicted O-methyltransferase YrrM
MASLKQYARVALVRVKRKRWLRGVQGISDVRAAFPGFDETIADIRSAGTNCLSFFQNGYKFEGGLRLQQNPSEFAALCVYLRAHTRDATYLEIGAASGGTCRFLSNILGFREVYIIDDGRHADARYQADNLQHVPSLHRFVGDSHSAAAADFLRTHLNGPLDVAFIDGDHSYMGSWQDAQLAIRFSRPGTLLVFHDTVACQGVELTWLRCVREKLIRPLAEYVGAELPLGIGVGEVL